MLWAHGVWQNADQSSRIWRSSDLFHSKLFGTMTAIREHWRGEELREQFWGSYILKTDQKAAREALKGENYAYLTIVNTPGEVVIAGKQEACQRVIDRLDCHALPMPFDAAIHNPAMEATYPDFVKLYTNPTDPQTDIQFYSAADYTPLPLIENQLARDIARMTCNPVDFPRLVNQVYQDGTRIFIEVGPQKTCSRWIEKILSERRHAAIPINKKYQPDFEGVLKVLSLLISHQVPVNLAPLTSQASPASDAKLKQNKGQGQFPSPPVDRPHAINQPAREGLSQHLSRHAERIARGHETFLKQQTRHLESTARLIQLQLGSAPQTTPPPSPSALYTKAQIAAFAKGDPRDCFGDLYTPFQGRRFPRLPNGALQLIDRVLDIQGTQGKANPGATLVSQYRVPHQAWFLEENNPYLSHVSLMEIALQPCGFLSAYLGSILNKPEVDFYFRNLNGEGKVHNWLPLPGKTITNRVELISSSTLNDSIIQEYAFQLSCQGQVLYGGTSSFGYFPAAMLANQAGLDRGKKVPPWKETHPGAGSWIDIPSPPSFSLTQKNADLPRPSRLWFAPKGGIHQNGYLYLTRAINPRDWYFKAHFYQDPVMPGSLGVELMAQALKQVPFQMGFPDQIIWRIKPHTLTTWKYRGQIPPEPDSIQLELHVKQKVLSGPTFSLTADASLWKNNLRIYQVEDLAFEGFIKDLSTHEYQKDIST
jgi:3-hydroxymyristoyl/3-hydroxydecanoyl-(acyl carrier protein) dehydratase/malonyl CoA-acyl carrier protein transacylase